MGCYLQHEDVRKLIVTYPLIILAPPRSFSSVISAMLGQHPQMYGLPELNLFAGDKIHDLIEYFESDGQRKERRWDGLLRAIAELFMGKQTAETVALARKWVLKHDDEMLARAVNAFPDARFIHLTRHPRSHGASMMELMEQRGWKIARGIYDHSTTSPTLIRSYSGSA